MELYELTCEISTNITEEEIKSIVEKIGGFLEKEEGKIEKITEKQKRKLAYPIKGHTEAFITDFIFELLPEKISGLNKHLKSEKEIIRYIILKKERRKIIYERMPSLKETTEEKKQETTKPKKVELKEIDQKIEEILGE